MKFNTRYKLQNTRYNFFRKAKKGFTMLELLIVIGITATLSVVGIGFYVNQQKAKILENTAQEIVGYLRYVQQKSMAQEQSLQWGVHFDNPTSGQDSYALYTGTTYSSSIETKYLPSGIIFTTPATGNSINISFNKLTGTSATSTTQSITIKSIVTNSTSTISVSGQGLISY